mgnify:CR=1 FL=1
MRMAHTTSALEPYGHPHEPEARWLVPRFGIPSHNYCTVLYCTVLVVSSRKTQSQQPSEALVAADNQAPCARCVVDSFRERSDLLC